jgi:hypothetical protein
MAKKKEEKQPTAVEEVNKIREGQAAEFIEETPETPKDDKETPSEDEDKKTPLKDKEELEKEPEKPAIDPEKLKEDISHATTEKIVRALVGEDKDKDDPDQELVSPWKKENRNPKDYDEIADWSVKKKEILDRRTKEVEEKANKEKETKTKEYQENYKKAFNKYIDEQLEDLHAANKLPRIKDKDDKNDYGLVCRKKLFETMMEVNKKRITEGKTAITSIKEIFYEHYQAPDQPAGDDAPVSPGGGGTPPSKNDDDYSYLDVHGKSGEKSFVDIALEK